jgi:hypothetical protein
MVRESLNLISFADLSKTYQNTATINSLSEKFTTRKGMGWSHMDGKSQEQTFLLSAPLPRTGLSLFIFPLLIFLLKSLPPSLFICK